MSPQDRLLPKVANHSVWESTYKPPMEWSSTAKPWPRPELITEEGWAKMKKWFGNRPWRLKHEKLVFLGYTQAWDFLLCAVLFLRAIRWKHTWAESGTDPTDEDGCLPWQDRVFSSGLPNDREGADSLLALVGDFYEDIRTIDRMYAWPGIPPSLRDDRPEYLRSLLPDSEVYQDLVSYVVRCCVSAVLGSRSS